MFFYLLLWTKKSELNVTKSGFNTKNVEQNTLFKFDLEGETKNKKKYLSIINFFNQSSMANEINLI